MYILSCGLINFFMGGCAPLDISPNEQLKDLIIEINQDASGQSSITFDIKGLLIKGEKLEKKYSKKSTEEILDFKGKTLKDYTKKITYDYDPDRGFTKLIISKGNNIFKIKGIRFVNKTSNVTLDIISQSIDENNKRRGRVNDKFKIAPYNEKKININKTIGLGDNDISIEDLIFSIRFVE